MDDPTVPRPGKKGLGALPRPQARYRLSRAFHNGKRFFDPYESKIKEDKSRARRLRKERHLFPHQVAEAHALAQKLEDGLEDELTLSSLASSVYFRDLRERVIGALWRLHRELRPRRRRLFTLIPRGYSVTPDELELFDTGLAKKALRQALQRAGAKTASGALIAFLHGEYDPTKGRFQLHWHGWAVGEMIKVVRNLRKQKRYDSSKTARAEDTDGVRLRVQVTNRMITSVPYALSYLLKSFWQQRASGAFGDLVDGHAPHRRVRSGGRVKEPEHSQYLLWLHRHRVEDLSLLVRVGVVDQVLKLTRE